MRLTGPGAEEEMQEYGGYPYDDPRKPTGGTMKKIQKPVEPRTGKGGKTVTK